jgi:hypothetical protein
VQQHNHNHNHNHNNNNRIAALVITFMGRKQLQLF